MFSHRLRRHRFSTGLAKREQAMQSICINVRAALRRVHEVAQSPNATVPRAWGPSFRRHWPLGGGLPALSVKAHIHQHLDDGFVGIQPRFLQFGRGTWTFISFQSSDGYGEGYYLASKRSYRTHVVLRHIARSKELAKRFTFLSCSLKPPFAPLRDQCQILTQTSRGQSDVYLPLTAVSLAP